MSEPPIAPITDREAADFAPDVRQFLLRYPSFSAALSKARAEAASKVSRAIQERVSKQPWFKTKTYTTQLSYEALHVWRLNWRGDVSPDCPWIRFSYIYRWSELSFSVGLYLDPERRTSPDACERAHSAIVEAVNDLPDGDDSWLEGGGWHLGLPGRPAPARFAVLLWSCNFDKETPLSAPSIVESASPKFEQLAQLIPAIEEVVKTFTGE